MISSVGILKQYGLLLRIKRRESNLSRLELSSRTGFSVKEISYFEQGFKLPTIREQLLLESALN